MNRPPLNQTIELVLSNVRELPCIVWINLYPDGSYSAGRYSDSPLSARIAVESRDRKQIRKSVIAALDSLEKESNEQRRERSSGKPSRDDGKFSTEGD